MLLVRAVRVSLLLHSWVAEIFKGYPSRRAMLQQLHGVSMYSHDEHHATTYSWSERGYPSRRAMLQQLHGVSMYSHDEHHATTYSWSERGKEWICGDHT
ncbi:syntaxin-binding protein 5-like isoform X1 [Tachysurus ichikawai]